MTNTWDEIGQAFQEAVEPVVLLATEGNEGKVRPSTKLYKLALDLKIQPFLDLDSGDTCCVVDRKGKKEVLRLGSTSFKAFLTKNYYDENGECPSGSATEETLRLLESDALDTQPVKTHLRLGDRAGKIYLDLADESGRVVEIDGAGWRIAEDPPLFRRNSALLPLPMPEPGGSLDLLRQFLNLDSEDSFRLAVGWLLGVLHPKGPYGVAILSGEHGSGKSSAGTFLKRVIDPDRTPRRSLPRDEDSLLVAALNHRVLNFDNLSGIKTTFSDELCRLASGAGISKRKLFSDGDEYCIEAARPLILNGIGLSPDRPDLMSRSLNIRLRVLAPGERRTEAVLERAFEKAHPQILGALLDAASAALRCRKCRPAELPRLADAASWIARAEQENGLPWAAGGFAEALLADQKVSEQEALSNSPVASKIIELMENTTLWTGLLKALLGHIRGDEGADKKFLPSNEKSLWSNIERLRPLLRNFGIEIKKTGRTGLGTGLRIWKTDEEPKCQLELDLNTDPFSLLPPEDGDEE